MSFVFDTSSFRILRHYYPNRFPSVWAGLKDLVTAGEITSTREVFNELERFDDPGPVLEWAKNHKEIFALPTSDETEFVARIFQVAHFQALIAQKSILTGRPVADPFVVAAAAVRGATVVTQESLKPNAAKIPNVSAFWDSVRQSRTVHDSSRLELLRLNTLVPCDRTGPHGDYR